jgi:flagellin
MIMGLFVMTNASSLNAQRNLNTNSRGMKTSYQRLSSGLRINSAADDAAGLAISTRFTSQIRGLNMAIRNANDGVSLAQTAEGALQESTSILQRMRELSVQAANDVNTSADRRSINDEIDQLVSELNRIGDTTTFNSHKILNGDFIQNFIHVGSQARETVDITISDARATALGRTALVRTEAVSTNALSRLAVVCSSMALPFVIRRLQMMVSQLHLPLGQRFRRLLLSMMLQSTQAWSLE